MLTTVPACAGCYEGKNQILCAKNTFLKQFILDSLPIVRSCMSLQYSHIKPTQALIETPAQMDLEAKYFLIIFFSLKISIMGFHSTPKCSFKGERVWSREKEILIISHSSEHLDGNVSSL